MGERGAEVEGRESKLEARGVELEEMGSGWERS